MATGSYWDRFTRDRITRRRALQMAGIGVASAGALAVVGCGGDDDDDGGSDASSDDADSSDSDSGDSDSIDDECIEDLVGTNLAQSLAESSDFDDLSDAMDTFADKAPSEIKKDARVVADAFQEYLEALEDADIDLDDPESFADADPDDLAEIGEIFEDEEFTDASDRLEDYFTEHCN